MSEALLLTLNDSHAGGKQIILERCLLKLCPVSCARADKEPDQRGPKCVSSGAPDLVWGYGDSWLSRPCGLFCSSPIVICFRLISVSPLSLPRPIRMKFVRCVRDQGPLPAPSLGPQLASAGLSPLFYPRAEMSPKSASPALGSRFSFLPCSPQAVEPLRKGLSHLIFRLYQLG